MDAPWDLRGVSRAHLMLGNSITDVVHPECIIVCIDITLLSVIINQKTEKVLDIEGEKGNDLQSRAEQSRAEQSRAEQSRAEQSKSFLSFCACSERLRKNNYGPMRCICA